MCYRRPGEPPIVKGHLVWGSANDFSSNAASFLQRSSQEYGDVFTIRLVNQYMTFINDPHSYEAMSREKNFDFDPMVTKVNWNVFGFVLKEQRKMLKEAGRTVKGIYLQTGLENYADNLQRTYNKLGSKAWQTQGLRTFAAKTILEAVFNIIFGRDDSHPFDSELVVHNFEIFHKYFIYLWLGMPKSWFPSAMRAKQELLTMPDADEILTRSMSDYIKTAIQYMQKQGQTEADIKNHNLTYLHVNYNTFRLSFWALSNLLEDEKAHAALMDELQTAINEQLDQASNTACFTVKDIEKLDVLGKIAFLLHLLLRFC